MIAHQKIVRDKISTNNSLSLFDLPYPKIETNFANAVIKEISFKQAEPLILEYEWIGTMPLPKSCRFIFGLYFSGYLAGAAVYVEPSTRQFITRYPRQVLQLNRGACAHWTLKNTASFFLSRTFQILKQQNIKAILAYCTPEAGEIGTIYQALNFDYIGQTVPSKSYFLDNHWISERTLADKLAWAKLRSPIWMEKFKHLPYKKLKGKHRYLMFLGTKKQKQKFMEEFRYSVERYPKRNTQEVLPLIPNDRKEEVQQCIGEERRTQAAKRTLRMVSRDSTQV